MSIEPHDAYDRVVFAYDGDRPGYRVAYDDRADDRILTVTINHVEGSREQRLTPQTEAVAAIIQHPDRGLVTDVVIELAGEAADVRLAFRVGLDVGTFYVDISHPDQAASAAGDDAARTTAGPGGARTEPGATIG
ncbi:hypothetical protein AB0C12_12770 [Actinoplanes sp. NPDC048967]|uniref:hypothetical protein n=1 Tax=Actinoplanes sp. NPDC048967 TaxID=3155269 RepID=UPI0033CD000E